MSIRDRAQASQLRLDIQRCQRDLSTHLQRLQGDHPLVRGSLYERRWRCGKSRCHCVRGDLHQQKVLAIRRGGRVRVGGLKVIDDAALEEAVQAWRAFENDRKALGHLYRGLLKAVQGLRQLREVPREALR